MAFDSQAAELNELIRGGHPQVYDMLSRRGKRIFFPKRGILSQSAEAAGKGINATIGTALEDNGSPLCLESVSNQLALNKAAFGYAPSPGQPQIRAMWKEMLFRKNPSLVGVPISQPIVTCALTHGLSMAGYLFAEESDKIIAPDLYWENYDLVFRVSYGAELDTYPIFKNGGYNIEGLRSKLLEGKPGKKLVILNFPNNPTGYTATIKEAQQIRDVLVEAAEAGNMLVILIDDAYFGLVFEEGIMQESLFALLANSHERILAIKFDGPTKEDYVWGFRIGFVTFGTAKSSPQLYAALEAKLAGAIRGTISNASNVGQAVLMNAYRDGAYEVQKRRIFEILKQRYGAIKSIFSGNPHYLEAMEPLPYNSGYFMCVRTLKANPEKVRQVLLNKHDSAVIVLGNVIRVAFSSTPLQKLPQLFASIYEAAKEVETSTASE